MFGLFDDPATKIGKKLPREFRDIYDIAHAYARAAMSSLCGPSHSAGEIVTSAATVALALTAWIRLLQEYRVIALPAKEYAWINSYADYYASRANHALIPVLTAMLIEKMQTTIPLQIPGDMQN